MKSDGSGGGIPPNSYVAGRKRRGSGSALDDFLHDRMAKMQQRGDTNSGVNQKAGHVDFQDLNDKENTPVSTAQQKPGSSRKCRGPSIQTILDGKSCGLSASTKNQSDVKKRGRGPGVNKLFNSLHEEIGSSGVINQETKKRVRGLGAKTLARRKLAQEAQNATMESAPIKHCHEVSADVPGSATPKSALTFQGCASDGPKSTPDLYRSHTSQNTVGHAQTSTISSCVVEKIGRDDCRRDFRPHSGASTSGAKDLLGEFDDALEQSDFIEDVYMQGQDDTANDPDMWKGYCSIGPPNATCAICRAVMWDMERNNKSNRNAPPSFSLCCKSGQKRRLQIEDPDDHEGERKIRDHVSMKEYYSSKLMIRLNEDIVGIILDKGETVVEATTPGMRQSIRFNLYDGRNMIRVVFNDEKVTLLGHIFDGDYPVDPIVILTSMRPHFRNGVLQVSSTEATKVYANIRYHVVWQIRQRIMFNSLRSLELSKTDWKIKIRVTRMWNSFFTNRELIGMNMILIDIEDYHIHAFVVAEACASLGSYFFERNMYIIENFATRRSIGYLRPVTSAMCIILNESTSVTPVPLELGLIARHKFEITELGDVYSIIRNLAPDQLPLYALDVIGLLEDLQPLQKVQTNDGLEDVVKFRIYDGSNSCYVTHWGPMNTELNQAYNDVIERPVVVILAGFKLSRIDGTAVLLD
ncbi:hypothetical protein ACET3Z_029384 [Daucus carota]